MFDTAVSKVRIAGEARLGLRVSCVLGAVNLSGQREFLSMLPLVCNDAMVSVWVCVREPPCC